MGPNRVSGVSGESYRRSLLGVFGDLVTSWTRRPDAPGRAIDPFASVWDDASLLRQRLLLRRVAVIAEACNIALYLYWGTLLGHVRQGGILPWDDDIDLAIFDWTKIEELRAALHAEGFKAHDHHWESDIGIKVWDPTYPAAPHDFPWSWPYIDIFIYALDRPSADGRFPVTPYPRQIILPGRITMFEGAPIWEPENPQAILDLQYPNWRKYECSPSYSHRREKPNPDSALRRIKTDKRGRKIVRSLFGGRRKTEELTNPLNHDAFLPLLRAWIDLCRQHDISYSIFWGTLLGQVRNQRIIPYDLDVDVVVGRSGLKLIHALPGRVPGCMFNDTLKEQPPWRHTEIRLVVRRDLISPDGSRYDHRGRLTPTQVDSCSFNGPLARLIIKLPAGPDGREYWHLDVFMFTDISHFDEYPPIQNVDELPTLEERPLEDLQVSCIKDPLPYLTAWYGADFMTPDHVYRRGRWVPRTGWGPGLLLR